MKIITANLWICKFLDNNLMRTESSKQAHNLKLMKTPKPIKLGPQKIEFTQQKSKTQ